MDIKKLVKSQGGNTSKRILLNELEKFELESIIKTIKDSNNNSYIPSDFTKDGYTYSIDSIKSSSSIKIYLSEREYIINGSVVNIVDDSEVSSSYVPLASASSFYLLLKIKYENNVGSIELDLNSSLPNDNSVEYIVLSQLNVSSDKLDIVLNEDLIKLKSIENESINFSNPQEYNSLIDSDTDLNLKDFISKCMIIDDND